MKYKRQYQYCKGMHKPKSLGYINGRPFSLNFLDTALVGGKNAE